MISDIIDALYSNMPTCACIIKVWFIFARKFSIVWDAMEGEDIGLFSTLVPKVLEALIEFWLVGLLSWMSKRFNH